MDIKNELDKIIEFIEMHLETAANSTYGLSSDARDMIDDEDCDDVSDPDNIELAYDLDDILSDALCDVRRIKRNLANDN